MEKMGAVLTKHDPESNMEYVTITRGTMSAIVKPMMDHPTLNKSVEETIEEEIKVPSNHDGKFDIPVFKYTPKSHGGGVIAIDASTYKPLLCHYAIECNAIVFNVDYRLAPETQCPNNIKDLYEVIKYVYENSEALGVDSSKIVVGGESGGGYISSGAMVMLAQNDQANMVKLAMINIPMVDDYCFSDPLAMT